MMTATWYNSPARVAALESAIAGWITPPTPFRENSAVRGPGGGVSCHNLAAELYFESGFIARRVVPHGRARAMIHREPEELLAQIDTFFGAQLAALDPATESPLPGDLIVIRVGRILLHLGVVTTGGQFVHVFRQTGVMLSPLNDSTYKIAAIRRPKP